jgi:hypothetical protein
MSEDDRRQDHEYRLRARGYAAAATQAVSRIATLKRLMSRAPF